MAVEGPESRDGKDSRSFARIVSASRAESNRATAKLAPQKEKESRAQFEHIEAIARRLMARDRSLTFGAALERVKLCLPSVQASIKEMLRQPVKAVEPKPRTMLIRGTTGTYVE